MRKRILIITILLGLMLLVTVGIASAQNVAVSDAVFSPFYNERPTETTPPAEPPEPTETPDPPEPPLPPANCELSEKEQKVAEKLAKRYDVEVDEIIDWYCQDFGFGEIAIAYEISHLSESSVEEIFTMREEGLTWMEILEEVGLLDEFPPARGKLPFPRGPVDFPGKFPVGKICTDGENSPMIEDFAGMFGMTYEQAYRWICGPFDYVNFGWEDWEAFKDMNGWDWEYMEGERKHITAEEWLPGDWDLGDLPDFPGRGEIPEPPKGGRGGGKNPPGFPGGRP